MKRIIMSAVFCVAFSILLSACSGSSDEAGVAPVNSSDDTQNTPIVTEAPENTDNAQQAQDTQSTQNPENTPNTESTPQAAKAPMETISPSEADFRNLKWGMTREEVIFTEGNGYREPEENILYYRRVREEDFPADAEYVFEDDKLAKATFYITENKENKPVQIKEFGEIVSSLSERFGEPTRIEMAFFDEADKTEDVTLHRDLILKNKLQYRTGWFLDGTDLRVVLFPQDGKMCIGLQYTPAE